MKYLIVILEIVIIILLIISPKKEDNLINKVNELELKIDSLNLIKDSIITVIDSTHVKIITNEKHYQERINTIITQPLSVDSQYISDYIGRYIESHQSYFQRTRETE